MEILMNIKRFIIGMLTMLILPGLSFQPAFAATNQQEVAVIPEKNLSTGTEHTCWLQTPSTVICWKYWSSLHPPTPPTGNFVQISSGAGYTCALRTNKTITCWGNNDWGQTNAPDGTFLDVSAGWYHTCARKIDETVTCWGKNEYHQSEPPSGAFKQISAGIHNTCGVRSQGTLDCWGRNSDNISTPPSGVFLQVSTNYNHSCAIRNDGTVDCWGNPSFQKTNPLAGTFKQISTARFHTCGLRTDDTIACWGSTSVGQTTPPSGSFIQLSSGSSYSCALPAGGTPICWGQTINPFLHSTATEDGWVLETSETSNTGGTLDATSNSLRLGDDDSNRQYRTVLSFDTSLVPDNAFVKLVVLKIRQNGMPMGGNPFATLGKLLVDIHQGPLGGDPTLTSGDFKASASAKKVGEFNATPNAGWYTVTLNQEGLDNINKTGMTHLRLYFNLDDNNNNAADTMRFLSGNSAIDKPWIMIFYVRQ